MLCWRIVISLVIGYGLVVGADLATGVGSAGARSGPAVRPGPRVRPGARDRQAPRPRPRLTRAERLALRAFRNWVKEWVKVDCEGDTYELRFCRPASVSRYGWQPTSFVQATAFARATQWLGGRWPGLKIIFTRWLRQGRWKAEDPELDQLVEALRWLGRADEMKVLLAEQARRSCSRRLFWLLKKLVSSGTSQTNKWLRRAVTGPPTTVHQHWMKSELVKRAYDERKAPPNLVAAVIRLHPHALGKAPWQEVVRAARARLKAQPLPTETTRLVELIGAAAGRAGAKALAVLRPLERAPRRYARALALALSAAHGSKKTRPHSRALLLQWLRLVGSGAAGRWALQHQPPRYGRGRRWSAPQEPLLKHLMEVSPSAYRGRALREGLYRAFAAHPNRTWSRYWKCPTPHRAAWRTWLASQVSRAPSQGGQWLARTFTRCGGDLTKAYGRFSRPAHPVYEKELLKEVFGAQAKRTSGLPDPALPRAVTARLGRYTQHLFDFVLFRITLSRARTHADLWLPSLVKGLARVPLARFKRGLWRFAMLAVWASPGQRRGFLAELRRRRHQDPRDRVLAYLGRVVAHMLRGSPKAELPGLLKALTPLPLDRFAAFDPVKWLLGAALEVRVTAPRDSEKWKKQAHQVQLDLYAAEKRAWPPKQKRGATTKGSGSARPRTGSGPGTAGPAGKPVRAARKRPRPAKKPTRLTKRQLIGYMVSAVVRVVVYGFPGDYW